VKFQREKDTCLQSANWKIVLKYKQLGGKSETPFLPHLLVERSKVGGKKVHVHILFLLSVIRQPVYSALPEI
jgi:hypothetical protein